MSQTEPFQPLAALAACVFPGAGQMVHGHVRRGAAVAVGVLGLFFGGILVGGVDVIDSKEDRVWFFGQAFVGPIAFAVDSVHQNRLKVREVTLDTRGQPLMVQYRTAHPNEGRNADGTPRIGGTPPNRKSIGKVNELGTLFATIAGMMNIIAIIDAALPARRGGGREGEKAG